MAAAQNIRNTAYNNYSGEAFGINWSEGQVESKSTADSYEEVQRSTLWKLG
jgi:hypothetical protein